MRVVVGEVIDDARGARVQLAPAELLGGDDLADRGLDEGRAAEEDRALPAHDDRLVAHRRNVGAARRAGAHDRGDLRDARGGHPCLVVEDATEVLGVGEYLVLHGQEGAARVDEIDAGQPVLERDLLRAQVLLDREREVGAALDGGVVGDDEDRAVVHEPDARDDAGARRLVVVEAVGGERRDLEERAALVQQRVDAITRQELAPRDVALTRCGGTAERGRREPLAKFVDERALRSSLARGRRDRSDPRACPASPSTVSFLEHFS